LNGALSSSSSDPSMAVGDWIAGRSIPGEKMWGGPDLYVGANSLDGGKSDSRNRGGGEKVREKRESKGCLERKRRGLPGINAARGCVASHRAASHRCAISFLRSFTAAPSETPSTEIEVPMHKTGERDGLTSAERGHKQGRRRHGSSSDWGGRGGGDWGSGFVPDLGFHCTPK
jgi:hypothetical protein